MSKVGDLIARLASDQKDVMGLPFVAPCIPGARLRVRVSGLLHTYKPNPPDFQGWGLFLAEDEKKACLMDEAGPAQIQGYIGRLVKLRAWLVRKLGSQTWLAVPANRSDARQKIKRETPFILRLVDRGQQFDGVIARWDGVFFWFDSVDRRADPVVSAELRESLAAVPTEELSRPGLTPELMEAYSLASAPELPPLLGTGRRRHVRVSGRTRAKEETKADESGHKPMAQIEDPIAARLTRALETAGGTLRGYEDRKDHLWVEWATSDGNVYHSAIARDDLTVITAGICLEHMDSHFDLQSLVGVMEGATAWWD